MASHVAIRQGLLIVARAGAATAGVVSTASLNLEDVLPHSGDLVLHELLSTLAQGHHGDHGRNADHDAEHGQCCLDFVFPEGMKGHLLNIKESHNSTSSG